MAGKFNINQLLSGTSIQEGETPHAAGAEKDTIRRHMLKVIPIKTSDLIPSKNNFYSVDKIGELKNSIEMFGVLQNLTVKKLSGGKYEIIAGHRRHQACMELVKEGKTEFEYIPCGIQAERDEIKEKILLIMTNSTTRELSDWEKMKQAEELQKYFAELKKRENLPGRVRDLVAEALNTSSTQIARMNAITNNLSDELKDEFQGGKIGLSAAYELSGLPEEKQQEAAEEFRKKGELSIDDVKEKKQEIKPTVTPPIDTNESESSTKDKAKNVWERFLDSMKEERITPTMQKTYKEPENYAKEQQNFEERKEEEQETAEHKDFADMSEEEKAESAIDFLNQKRFTLFTPGEDTRVFDFIIEMLEYYTETRD
ncbi:hypothetical protein FACS1894111_05860 [Clostridia bacterium]|nr:hypothetical protein FACS1894111_05860 [Clostridia bacterium]